MPRFEFALRTAKGEKSVPIACDCGNRDLEERSDALGSWELWCPRCSAPVVGMFRDEHLLPEELEGIRRVG